jgi:hypothetical protein
MATMYAVGEVALSATRPMAGCRHEPVLVAAAASSP